MKDDDPTLILLNETSHDLFLGIQGPKGQFLTFTHEAAVTPNIRTQDGGYLTLNFFCGHGIVPLKV